LLVDAIEREFIALAVHNNAPGTDAETLARYREPAWNNPVVRFFAPDGKELVERRDGVYGADALAERMIAALERARRPVPRTLALAHQELAPAELERALFGMPCFWHGQAQLGRLAGVRSARVGFLEGREAVEVRFDPAHTSYEVLVRAAQRAGCTQSVWAVDEEQRRVAQDVLGAPVAPARGELVPSPADELYHLERSALRHLPLTPLQALRVNAALEAGEDAGAWLTPGQHELLERVRVALAGESRQLEGLSRPAALEELAGYAAALEARLRAHR
jgi:hypothetical protein